MMTVLVTGANGHIGYHVTRWLVGRGYRVRAGVRQPNAPLVQSALLPLGVELVRLELLEPASVQAAVRGVSGIFHTAGPFCLQTPNPLADLLRPHVTGTRNLLRAAFEQRVRRVIYTASLANVGLSASPDAAPLDERDWNELPISPLTQAMVTAERQAWAYAREHEVDLVTILPGTVLGPACWRLTPAMQLMALALRPWPLWLPELRLQVVDVRDLAQVHGAAFEHPKASGRYLVAGETCSLHDLLQQVRQLKPRLRWGWNGRSLPVRRLSTHWVQRLIWWDRCWQRLSGRPGWLPTEHIQEMSRPPACYDDSRVRRELHWTGMPLSQTLKETVQWLLEPNTRATTTLAAPSEKRAKPAADSAPSSTLPRA